VSDPEDVDISRWQTSIACGAKHLHLVAEAAKRCWEDRHRYLGDPDFVAIPIEQMLSDATAKSRARDVRERGVRRGNAANTPTT
jgi:gamma-glutamyltranspeptidase / glutathione hydrolase